MKCCVSKYFSGIATLLLTITVFSGFLYAQSQEEATPDKKSTSLSLVLTRKAGGDYQMKASLAMMTETGRTLLKGVEISFAGGDDLGQIIGKQKTNLKGSTVFTFPKDRLPAANEEGFRTFGAVYAGCDTLESTEDQVSTQDLMIEVSPVEEDSVRNIHALVWSVGKDGEKIPLTETDIIFYVPRMFSYLKIGEATLDSSGSAMVEFPKGLPGDEAGNITVIAKIEEHDTFGNAEGETRIDWAMPARLIMKDSYRALWSQIAPTWMIVTLIIMLAGVWGHYAYAVYKLVKIKKTARKLST